MMALNVSFVDGTSVMDAIKDSIRVAKMLHVVICFTFHTITIFCAPSSDPQNLYEKYLKASCTEAGQKVR